VKQHRCPHRWHPKAKLYPYHGIIVIRSGLLPSSRQVPMGSRTGGKLAETREPLIKSYIASCLDLLPALFKQLRPKRPFSFTWEPQIQVWLSQILDPSLSEVAILSVWLSSKVPKLEDGKATSHLPAGLEEAESKRLLSVKEGLFSKRLSYVFSKRGRSTSKFVLRLMLATCEVTLPVY